MSFIEPGTGHPAEVATRQTPIAHDADDVRRLATSAPTLAHLEARESVCRACPRLVEWRERVARDRRAAYADEEYWGRPVPSWGAETPRVLVVGLAPAAHGGNRTGRMFTGDRSGDWLFAALHRAGLANQRASTHAGDGLQLIDTRVVAPVHCAPPANQPTPEERDTCMTWLVAELRFLRPTVRSVVALGGFAWQATWSALAAAGYDVPERRRAFRHGVEVEIPGGPLVIGSYHVSQQNTFTGRLTEPMLDAVFSRAATA
jgi:uracil-DNA glycosylase family 4